MKLLVTGAMGHVGYEIAKQAAHQGKDVLAIYLGERPAADADLGPRVTWLSCDLTDAAAVQALAARHDVDACIHAAAVSNEAYARPNPLAAISTNIGATANLLDAARVKAWRRFILLSSGSVFEKRTDKMSPILEDQPVAPGNIYSTTKASAELLTRMYRTEFGLSAAAVRLSWVFGPPVVSDQPTRGPIPSFLMRTLRGEAIRETGGDFAASFTFVGDVAAGLLAAAKAAELRHAVYHLGHGVNFTARQVAEAIGKICPGASFELGGGTEPWTRFTAIRGPLAGPRLSDDTGFAPATSLEAAIAIYADWLRAHPAAWR